jgi:predicted PurR-regulated permease PerM
MNDSRTRLERNLGLIVLFLLLFGCAVVLLPFVSAMLWGTVLAISCWPAYERLLRVTGNRRTLASLLMLLGMVLIVLLPLAIVGVTLADNVSALTGALRNWIAAGPPAPPEWLGKVPIVGAKAVDAWQSLASDTGKLLAKSKEWIQPISAWLLASGLMLGRGLLELALSVLISVFLFRNGVAAVERLSTVVERISGEKGQRLMIVAGKTIRGVVYGILGTALIQGLLAGVGFFIAGVPGAALLALLSFFFSIVPVIGTGLVWIPTAFWLFHQGSTGWGIFMIIWGLAVGNLDNFIKPWLISQGSDMPFILVFFGVIGGALTFGFIGVFLGPTLLAVGWRVVEGWASPGSHDPEKSSTEAPSDAALRVSKVSQPKDSAVKL